MIAMGKLGTCGGEAVTQRGLGVSLEETSINQIARVETG